VSTTTRTPREVAEGNERQERRVIVASAGPLDLLDALLDDLDEVATT
jgi:hypothetical protein